MGAPYRINAAETTDDIRAARVLFEAYAASLAIDLGYQDFAAELDGLPGRYAPPQGALLLARNEGGEAIGCIALRSIEGGVCEMKRLYVDPRGRGLGLGAALVDAIIARARDIGYMEMRLDTLPEMTAAISLYRAAGFDPIPAYYDTPVAGTVFLACRLAEGAPS